MRPFTPFLCLAVIAVILFGSGALSAPLPSPVASGHSHRAKRMDGIDKVTHWLAENDGNHLEALKRLLDRTSTPETTDLHISEPSTPTQQWASSSGVSAQPALGSYDTHGYTSVQHLHPGGKPDYAGPSVAGQPHGYGIYHHNAHWPFSGDAQGFHQPAPEQYGRGTTGIQSYDPAHEQALVHDHGSAEDLLRPGSDLSELSRIDLTSEEATARIENIVLQQPQVDLMQVGDLLLKKDRVRAIIRARRPKTGGKERTFAHADSSLNAWLRKVYQRRVAESNDPRYAGLEIKLVEDASILDTIQKRLKGWRQYSEELFSRTGLSESHPLHPFKVGGYWIRGANKAGVVGESTPIDAVIIMAYSFEPGRPPITFGRLKLEKPKLQQQ